MIHEHYVVVELPKEESGDIMLNNSDTPQFAEFEEAFEHFNSIISLEGAQIFKQPRRPCPLRVSLKNSVVELWCVKRTDELLTN